MRRGALVFLVFALIFGLAALAHAQSDPAPDKTQQVTEYGEKEWVAPLVEGDLALPDGTLITGRRPPKTSKLITVRTSFRTEILKSVEDM
jgi:hypothetical protein